MDKNGLTMTLVFDAQSANYGEGFGNITVLKKYTGTDGNMYSYISRQAIRYNIVSQLQWDKTPVNAEGKGDKKVVQFAPEATIAEYPEIDLFGYMKTTAKGDDTSGGAATRSAVCRLGNATSLSVFNSDTDYLTNMGLAKRKEGLDNSIAQSEIHRALYAYTVTIDLDRVGIDGNICISSEEKAGRVKKLLEAVQFLYRDIKGRRENLAPVFAVGGIYSRKNPYFEGRVKLSGKGRLNAGITSEVIKSSEDTKANTKIGMVKGIFNNDEQICELLPIITVSEFFEGLKKEVDKIYV